MTVDEIQRDRCESVKRMALYLERKQFWEACVVALVTFHAASGTPIETTMDVADKLVAGWDARFDK